MRPNHMSIIHFFIVLDISGRKQSFNFLPTRSLVLDFI